MKNKILWLIISIALTAGILLMAIGFFAGPKNINVDSKGIHIMKTEKNAKSIKEENLESFENIYLNFSSQNIQISTGDSYAIEIETVNVEDIVWEIKDGKLTINDRNKNIWSFFKFGFNIWRDTVKITVPKEVILNNVAIELSSGKFDVSDIKCKELFVKQSSGDSKINNTNADETLIKMTSGQINISNSKFSKSDIYVTSGNINADKSSFNDLYAETTSGGININGDVTGDIVTKVTSGSIKMYINGVTNDYSKKVKITSGNVKINGESISNDYTDQRPAPNSLDMKVTSGNIRIDFIK